MSFFLLLNTQKDILKNVGNQTVDKKENTKSTRTIDCLVTNILRNIFFCVQQKKEIHTGLEQHEG